MNKYCVLLKYEARTVTGTSKVVNPGTPSHVFLGSVGEMISFSIFLHFYKSISKCKNTTMVCHIMTHLYFIFNRLETLQ
jgi:hypothetical protein